MDSKLKLMGPVLLIFLLVACANGVKPMLTAKAKAEDPFVIVSKADQAYLEGDWLTAEHYYHSLTRAIPSDSYAWARLGNIKLRQNNFEGAISSYQRAIERDNSDARSHYNLATAHLLRAREALRDAQQALPSNDAAVQIIDKKLSHFSALVYGPVVEIASPNDGLIKQLVE